MKRTRLFLPLSLFCALAFTTEGRSQATAGALFDVLHYNAQVEPDIQNKTVKGKVLVRVISRANNLTALELDCGDLVIDAVREKGQSLNSVRSEKRLRVELSRPAKANEKREIEIEYHGAPRRGIRFRPEQGQVHTVFSTSQWLVCIDAPDDRATLRLKLIVPSHLKTVANGKLIDQRPVSADKVAYEWEQAVPIPTYVFGFAAGPYRVVSERRGRVELYYLDTTHDTGELRRIFRDTADMIEFYEQRSGVRYVDSTYTQVLAAGGADQEMSGFTVLHQGYGDEVLKNERDVWLAAHELAHQWWGNMVTCRDWNHFWLNEGMATFMAAAYKEHRFGRDEYLREIEANRANYEKVRDSGKDRSLVFPDWLSPTPADRTLVYDKGSYVLHQLREELGERDFWAGLRQYTRKYFGKSVTTPDFQKAMEKASGKNLTEFFSRWVYLTKS